MLNRFQTLDNAGKEKLHAACMEVLGSTGVIFEDDEALEIFKANDFKVEGNKVFFREEQVKKALETTPSEFIIRARDPEKSVRIGGDHFALSPGWGAPFVMDADGTRRSATMDDVENFLKLVQGSKYIDMTASGMVAPPDLDPKSASAELLASTFIYSDKPLTGNPSGRQNSVELLEMASIVWGSREEVIKSPVSITSINPTSPLIYGPEAAGSVIELARGGQALLISSMVMAGLSGPITLAGTAVIEMAESLAGIVLAQLVRPGTPCVCGGTSCGADLRLCAATIGSPELLKLMNISNQMARYYGLPCRYGGGLTDAHCSDMQAGMESALTMALSLAAGTHYMHQACGILGAYTAMSLEKFVMDEELAGMVRRALEPVEFTDETLNMDAITRIGAGGSFLMEPTTAMRCRTEFFLPTLAYRNNHTKWVQEGSPQMLDAAAKHVQERLAAYTRPDMDPAIEKDLMAYIDTRRGSATTAA
ncbi:trimethylamine methyltransferase family protein [Desulfoluna butyratoxydans]|uniref:Methyltransferase n=1 Tax=Desulfoluna butyratoxydans TaxID=231438 RepID=A0A4U8YSP6_9BACT|nr:trimethylamine methyltransferase family protein [Desulfoluna butyratoxydans]VFQ46931.1 trimethylamine methyltransferase [Desulfoluna butyratoxydans]